MVMAKTRDFRLEAERLMEGCTHPLKTYIVRKWADYKAHRPDVPLKFTPGDEIPEHWKIEIDVDILL